MALLASYATLIFSDFPLFNCPLTMMIASLPSSLSPLRRYYSFYTQSSIGASVSCTPIFSPPPSKLARLLRSPGACAVRLKLPVLACFLVGKREERLRLSFFSGRAAAVPFVVSGGGSEAGSTSGLYSGIGIALLFMVAEVLWLDWE